LAMPQALLLLVLPSAPYEPAYCLCNGLGAVWAGANAQLASPRAALADRTLRINISW
jgi:hypothetical protein